MKWRIPQEPNKALLDLDSRFEWFNRLWRHIKGDDSWIVATLQNSWVRFDTTFSDAQYRLKGGVVYIEGRIKSGTATATTVLFTLPEGYRPAEQLEITTTSNAALGRFDIKANGDVIIQVGSNVSFSLNCSFVADQ